MHRNIKESEMTSTQLFILSMQTCQWWNANIFGNTVDWREKNTRLTQGIGRKP